MVYGGNSADLFKGDDSRKTFLFTLKNPHKIPAKRFELKDEEKTQAIVCDSRRGPWFRNSICVYDDCKANTESYTSLGRVYTNDTGLVVFTGSYNFKVKEIEVFEITV
jgi:hypothetical protein